MRLFIAINLTDDEKKDVLNVQAALKKQASRGNFSRPENLHLTLAFLGEVLEKRVPIIEKVMDHVPSGTFTLDFDKIGTFRRSGGSIYYLAAKPNEKAEQISDYLKKTLAMRGFTIDDKPFVPHLTLGREVLLEKAEPIPVPIFHTEVAKISLMKSERIKGVLTYTEIYEKSLKER